MVRNDYWNFDQDLEGVRSLGAVLDDASFVLPQRGMRVMLDLYQFRGCKGLQPSKVNVVFQGGMASVVLTGKIADTCSDTSLTGG